MDKGLMEAPVKEGVIPFSYGCPCRVLTVSDAGQDSPQKPWAIEKKIVY